MPSMSGPLAQLGTVTAVFVPLWLLCSRLVFLRWLKVGEDQEVVVLRSLRGVLVSGPGFSVRVRPATFRDPDLEVDWPRPYLAGRVSWRGQVVTGGAWLPSALLLPMLAALQLLLSGLAVGAWWAWGPGYDLAERQLTSPQLAYVAGHPTTPPPLRCPLELGSHVFVDVNGVPFVLDTGAENSALLTEQLGRIGAPSHVALQALMPRLTVRGFGAGPPADMRAVPIRGLEVCGHAMADTTFWAIAGVVTNPPAVGILGMRQLADAVLVVDLEQLELWVSHDLESVRARHPWIEGPGLPLLDDATVEGSHDGAPVRIQFDTGNRGLTSVRPGLPSTGPAFPEHPDLSVRLTGGGGVQGRSAPRTPLRAGTICVGDLCLEDLLVDPNLNDGDVNLGLDVLLGRVLVIDRRAGRLWVRPTRVLPEGAELEGDRLEAEVRAAIEARSGSGP